MIANVIILLLVFGYCGLVIYWKRTGVLTTDAVEEIPSVKASARDTGRATMMHCGTAAAAAVDAVAAADIAAAAAVPMHIIWTAIRQLRNIDPVRCLRLQAGQHM